MNLAAKKKAVLQVGHVQRYSNAFKALAKRVDKALYIDAERLAGFKQRGAEVDVILDLMIHDLDLALLAGALGGERRQRLRLPRADQATSTSPPRASSSPTAASPTFRRAA